MNPVHIFFDMYTFNNSRLERKRNRESERVSFFIIIVKVCGFYATTVMLCQQRDCVLLDYAITV